MGIGDYIMHFDKTFGTNITETTAGKRFPLLEVAFEDLGERVYALNANSRNINKKKVKTYEKMEATFTDEQRALIDEYFEEDAKYWEDEEMQMMIFGFCLAYEQLKEMGALKN